mgnify:CR=1 FL=1
MDRETPRFPGTKLRKRESRVTFRTTPEERRRLLAEAIRRGITVSQLVRGALREVGVLETQD